MGHAVGDDVLCPLLESCLNYGLVVFDEIANNRIHLGEFVDDVLVYHLECSHTHKCLLMTMVEVDRHISTGNAFHINLEHIGCHSAITLLACGCINERSITGNGHNLTVDAGYVAPCLCRRSLLHLASYLINIGHIALLVIIVRQNVFELRSVVLRLHATRAVIFHRRFCCTLATGMVKLLAIDEYIGGVSVPEHLQSRVEPVGLSVHLQHHILYLAL